MKTTSARGLARRGIVAGLASIVVAIVMLAVAAPAQAATTLGVGGSGTDANGSISVTNSIRPFEFSGVSIPLGIIQSHFNTTETDGTVSSGSCILPLVWKLEYTATTISYQCLGLASVTDAANVTTYDISLLSVTADGAGTGSVTVNGRTYTGSVGTPITVSVVTT